MSRFSDGYGAMFRSDWLSIRFGGGPLERMLQVVNPAKKPAESWD